MFALSESPKCILNNKKGSISGPDADRVYQQGSIGEMDSGKLILSDVEILYLLERDKIQLIESGKQLTFPELAESLSKEDQDLWLRFLLYSDLRRRGYLVKPGYGPQLEYRVYRRGALMGKEPAKYLIYGLIEGEPITINELSSISSSAKLSKKDLVLAIIDRQGEITYYDASEVTL